ncbi:MAG: hypothetical protein P4L46_10355 [Fimbriimonas sp.]|nr:hypothetical protein [Fimbriimonas sp.]
MPELIPAATIHGRFQPFHSEHLDYAVRAFERAEFVWIGLTNSLPIRPPLMERTDRLSLIANPLTYYERIRCIQCSLKDAGIDAGRFGFLPCPIEQPEHLNEYFPKEVPAFITVVEEWSRRKIDILTSRGYQVEILCTRGAKSITGTTIRRLIESGDPHWRSYVSVSTALYLDSLDLAARLAGLREISNSR